MWGNTIAKQNHVEKHCSNLQCFKKKKLRSKILNQFNMKKNKIDKYHSEKKGKKIHKKKEKKLCRET